MVEIDDINPSLLLEAVLAWTGWQQEGIPRRKKSFLVDKFGSNEAARLLPAIQALEDDFYQSDARFVADGLAEMGKLSADQFRRKYPDLPDEISEAFAWCYTFDYK